MTFVITNACIDVRDQSCIEVCPVDCIHFDEGHDRMCYVHPDECIDCAACESACPVGAIFADAQLPSEMAEFTAINAQWFEDKAAARQRVDGIAGQGLSVG
ncbi:MAG: ferredoxin family protein [Gammaproteobacteria bacterium]|nr:ferredoxin family protein [Gammaproteobacteria bacterium]MCY4344898.1 ferredoxin family protein [Gammaproteobacteria bacterium]